MLAVKYGDSVTGIYFWTAKYEFNYAVSKSICNAAYDLRNFFKTKPVLKAYVFVSYARGEANNNSDIDILLELDYNEPIGLEFIEMKWDLEKVLHKTVDLVASDGLSKFIAPYIHQDKKLIYERPLGW